LLRYAALRPPPADIFGNRRLFTSDVEAWADAYVLLSLIRQVLHVWYMSMLPNIEYLVGRNVRKSTAMSSADIWRNAVKAERDKWLGIEEGRFGLLLDLG
jgi:hypothetical protein